MTSDLSVLAAFLGGLLTVLAPCSVMVLPAFFSYALSSPGALVARTALFWLGLATTLVPLAAAASSLGLLLREHSGALAVGGGLVLVVLGVVQALSLPLHLPALGRRAGKRAGRSGAASPLSVYLLGALYGLAGVGCAGPILGAVLVLAGIGGQPVRAVVMVLVYATGMVVPLGVLALLWDSAGLSRSKWLRPRPVRVLGRVTTLTELVGGLACVALGLVMVLVGPHGLSTGVLSTAQMARLEESVLAHVSLVPWWLVVAVLGCLVAAVVVAWRGQRTR